MSPLTENDIAVLSTKEYFTIYEAAMLWIEEQYLHKSDYLKLVKQDKPFGYYDIASALGSDIQWGETDDYDCCIFDRPEIDETAQELRDQHGWVVKGSFSTDDLDFFHYKETTLDPYRTTIYREDLVLWARSKGLKPRFLAKDIEEMEGTEEKTKQEERTKQEETRTLPDPSQHTTAKVWMTKNSTYHISTKTNGQKDGQVDFTPNKNGEMTKQMQLMMLLVEKWPKGTNLAGIVSACYSQERGKMPHDVEFANKLLKRVRALVSDVRNKLEKTDINPDIITPLSVESVSETPVKLRVFMISKVEENKLQSTPEKWDRSVDV
jgi:hypothetical protein